MTKIDREAAEAFINHNTFKSSKTEVTVSSKGAFMFVHGNEIARVSHGHIEITNAGYNTNLTKNRLNAILYRSGRSCLLIQMSGAWYFINNISLRKVLFIDDVWHDIDDLIEETR